MKISHNKKALTNVFGIIFVNKNKKVLNKYGPDLIIILLKNLNLNLFCNQYNTKNVNHYKTTERCYYKPCSAGASSFFSSSFFSSSFFSPSSAEK